MGTMEIVVESVTEEALIGTRCACGGCHPTATVYRNDPRYERHSPKLAQAPCCCGRFFAVGVDAAEATERAEALTRDRADGLLPMHYELQPARSVALPWGGEVSVVVGDFAHGGELAEIYAAHDLDDPFEIAIDPVCDMEVVIGQAAAASEHEGKRYYFCALGCKKRFDRDPAKYLGGAA